MKKANSQTLSLEIRDDATKRPTFPPFQPHWTASLPPTATPTPASAETIEYVVETGHESRVQIMSHVAETERATVKARSSRPAFLLKTEREMMPFLMVPATLAPTRTALEFNGVSD